MVIRINAGGGKLNPRRGIYIVLFSVATLVIIAFSSCTPSAGGDIPTPTQPPTTTPGTSPSTEPGLIKSWLGNDTKKTETFTITRDSWEIRWSSDPQVTGGNNEALFQVFVHDIKLGSFPVDIAANTQKKGSGTYTVRRAGQFFLQIDAMNTKWTVEVIQN